MCVRYLERPYRTQALFLGRHSLESHSAARSVSRASGRGYREGRKTAGALVFTLRGEDPDNQTAPPRTYVTVSPQLIWNPMRARPVPSGPQPPALASPLPRSPSLNSLVTHLHSSSETCIQDVPDRTRAMSMCHV